MTTESTATIEQSHPPAPAADESSGATIDAGTPAPAAEPKSQRRRADDALAESQRLREQVGDLERSIAEAREALDNAERRHRIDLSLIEAGAIDLESARLLTELAVTHMPGKDIGAAIADLRRTKPFLFRSRTAPNSGATMSAGPAGTPGAPGPELSAAAEDAARSGDRKSLLRYLRARRGAA